MPLSSPTNKLNPGSARLVADRKPRTSSERARDFNNRLAKRGLVRVTVTVPANNKLQIVNSARALVRDHLTARLIDG